MDPADPNALDPTKTAADGRDTAGRFAPGNKLAKGNQGARQVAIFRAALLRAITEQDINDVVKTLINLAKGNCEHDSDTIAASRLLLSYTVGRPPDIEEGTAPMLVVFKRPDPVDDPGDSLETAR